LAQSQGLATDEWDTVVTDLARLGLLPVNLLQLVRDVQNRGTVMTHTPGPWHVSYEPFPHIMRLRASEPVPVTGEIFERADARLIAAAPDLLLALKELETTIPYALQNSNIAKAARAAIAKAEGGSLTITDELKTTDQLRASVEQARREEHWKAK
jgi:hypothetical protein